MRFRTRKLNNANYARIPYLFENYTFPNKLLANTLTSKLFKFDTAISPWKYACTVYSLEK